MTFEERISLMRENLGNDFVTEAKKILGDGKVLKGEIAKETFNTELNELTFEIEELYPLDYETFKANFPNTIKLVEKVPGNNILDNVNKGFVIQSWNTKTNVDQIIENIKKNVTDADKAQEEIKLRENVFEEIQTMKKEFDIEWSQDLFWKCWKIKEGERKMSELIQLKGEKLAQKRINTIKEIGGIDFLKELQKEVYPTEI